MRISFVEDFKQHPNSAIDHKNRSFLSKHFVSDLLQCDDCESGKSKLQDRQANDDYFPQGEEYEEEIGVNDSQLSKKTPSKISPKNIEDEYDNFKPTMLTLENNKCINPLKRFITRVHFPSGEELIEANRTMLMSKKVSNKDAVEKLQILIEKVTEFKRRVFQPKRDVPKIGATTDGKKEGKIVNEKNESTNRCLINQKISTSVY